MELIGQFEPRLVSWVSDRFGVSRIVIKQGWSEEVLLAPVPNPPIAVPFLRREINPAEDGGWGETFFYYEGVAGAIEDRVFYSFDGSFNQEPITSHPNIGKLLKTYEGQLEDGEIVWSPRDPTGRSRRTGFNARGERVESINPMYGVSSYLSIGAVWTVSRIYMLSNIPASILRGIGTIFTAVPGSPPTPPRRNWLKMAPTAKTRGNVLEVNEHFMLSGIGGWVKPVYDGSDLDGESEES